MKQSRQQAERASSLTSRLHRRFGWTCHLSCCYGNSEAVVREAALPRGQGATILRLLVAVAVGAAARVEASHKRSLLPEIHRTRVPPYTLSPSTLNPNTFEVLKAPMRSRASVVKTSNPQLGSFQGKL